MVKKPCDLFWQALTEYRVNQSQDIIDQKDDLQLNTRGSPDSVSFTILFMQCFGSSKIAVSVKKTFIYTLVLYSTMSCGGG